MSDCYVSKQIAIHCDDKEFICSECGSLMEEDDDSDLVCTECDHYELNYKEEY